MGRATGTRGRHDGRQRTPCDLLSPAVLALCVCAWTSVLGARAGDGVPSTRIVPARAQSVARASASRAVLCASGFGARDVLSLTGRGQDARLRNRNSDRVRGARDARCCGVARLSDSASASPVRLTCLRLRGAGEASGGGSHQDPAGCVKKMCEIVPVSACDRGKRCVLHAYAFTRPPAPKRTHKHVRARKHTHAHTQTGL